jgi:leucyl-tRNA synthetase
MGYDAFGLPAEQYAIQKGVHPAIATEENIKRFRTQLKNIGLSYDWSRELKTCDPDYYKWTQHIFLLLFEHYYDVKENKARPIEQLVNHFEHKGTEGLTAFTDEANSFSAEDWQSYSAKKKDELLMHYRLAYRKVSYVNWCEELGTVLANDEVVNGVSERGGYPVVQKPMLQWSLRITAYADRLLEGLQRLDWSTALKTQQENWIGRSEGATIFFEIEDSEKELEVFTTRPDTIFGCTFMVMAPEHEWIDELTSDEFQSQVQEYRNYVQSRSEIERMSDKKITGAFTGSFAIHPFSGKQLPIYISEYVLKDYGTGAIMAVPSNDERDHRFAEKFGLDEYEILDMSDYPDADREDKVGILKNSDFLNGLKVAKAIEEVVARLEIDGKGQRKVNYKLRDANFSRQRYWGEPFPILYDKEDVAHAVDRDKLPVELPAMEDIRSKEGKSPLSANEEWVNEVDGYTREVDTMPGFAGSSWYFLRYMDPHNDDAMFSEDAVSYWQDVDCYIGGTEHAVGHLMYARFWHKFLFDLGKVPTNEPFKKLINQGMIQGRSLLLSIHKKDAERRLHIPIQLADEKDRLYKTAFKKLQLEDLRFEDVDINKDLHWKEDAEGEAYLQLQAEIEKMSKSKYNVVNPDEVIEEYGADCFRLFEMFLGPIEDHKPWDMQSISGVLKFLNRFWSLYYDEQNKWIVSGEAPTKEEYKALHTCIKKVNEDIERLSFNTCVSALMIAVNDLKQLNCHKSGILKDLVRLLAPFAPHMAEEIWSNFDEEISVCDAHFPQHEEKYLIEDEVEYPICVNGKKRGEATFSTDLTKDELAEAAKELDVVQKWAEGKNIRKVIVVPKRMINVVVN